MPRSTDEWVERRFMAYIACVEQITVLYFTVEIEKQLFVSLA
jgi:hypothetical protein